MTLPSGGTQVQSFSETSRLFDWGFENFSYQTVLEEAELVKEVSVALSKVDHVSVHPAADVELLLPKGTDPASLERTLDLESPVDAPVTEGQVLGTLSLSLEGEVLTTVDLLASHDVEASRPAAVLAERAELLQFHRGEGGWHRVAGAGGRR